ncbi:MAG TPA: YceI family protein [bacterium]|nr:YceI family protein [bacterium]
MRLWSLFSAAAAIALSVSAATAEVQTYIVDPAHSEVGFNVRHLVSKVPGRFDEYDGTIAMDPAAVESTMKINATIKTASINTGVEKRDDHLRSADFFEAEKYPQITFVSKKVAKKGAGYAVTGDLTMHGVTKEVTLDAEILGTQTNPFTKMPSAGVEMTGKINRKDFGILWNKTLDEGGAVLGDEVNLVVRVEANVPAPEPATKS